MKWCLAAVVLVVAAGCGSGNSEPNLVGKWKNPFVQTEYRADGTETSEAMGVKSTSRWKLVKVEPSKTGHTLTIEVTPEGMDPRPQVLEFEGANKYTQNNFVYERQ